MCYFDRHLSYGELERPERRPGGTGTPQFRRGDRRHLPAEPARFPRRTLAAWKLGGIVATINPMNREFELAKLLDDAPKADLPRQPA